MRNVTTKSGFRHSYSKKSPTYTHLRLSILTATVVTVSAEQSPYAVALTTFPNAPEPRVLPVGTHEPLAFHW